MATNFQGLSTLGEDEERSTAEMQSARITQEISAAHEEEEALDDLENIAPSVKLEANKFRMLCFNVQNSLSEIDNSMFELLELKDNLLLQFLPPNVSTRIALVISRLYRAYSLSQIPIHELVRLALLYSQPFDMKSVALQKLYENNETKKRMLNIALTRLTSMESTIRQYQLARSVQNWERMYIQLALPRSNARKWKFRLRTFRDMAHMGYEHVVDWLNSNATRRGDVSDIRSDEDLDQDHEEMADPDRAETFGDIVSVPEMDEQGAPIDQTSEFGDELGSDNEGSFLSSAGRQRTKRQGISGQPKEPAPPQQPPVITKTDSEVQVKPDYEHQSTSTGDVLSSKALIMRIYRPVGLQKTKFQCIVHAHKHEYPTQVFIVEKSSSAKGEAGKSKGRLTGNRATKTTDPKAKKTGADSTTPEEGEMNTIDKNQVDELLIPMPSFLKRRSLFTSGADPDSIQIDVLGDEKLCGSLSLSPEDLRMLDLPNLSSPTSAPLIIIDDSVSTTTTPSPSLSMRFDFDQPSYELYKAWVSRTPQTYTVYDEKNEPIAKLPLLMFWFNKVEITHATKCTMTAPLQVRVPTPKTVYVPQAAVPVETREQSTSPAPAQAIPAVDHGTDPALSRLENLDEHLETLRVAYEDQIAKLHEGYQAEIRRLTKLLNETPSRRSSQMAELSEMDETMRDAVDEAPAPHPQHLRRPLRTHPKREAPPENQPPPVYGKNLPKKFLDRYQMFLQRSIAHRHQLISKVEQETAQAVERQMEIQHRLHKPDQSDERYDDLCLPAVFMPFRSGNVFNPRAYRFFHHIGSTDPRLTQTPSVFKLPPLPSGSVSVLNLFELSRCYEVAGEKDRATDKNTSQATNEPPAPPATQTSN